MCRPNGRLAGLTGRRDPSRDRGTAQGHQEKGLMHTMARWFGRRNQGGWHAGLRDHAAEPVVQQRHGGKVHQGRVGGRRPPVARMNRPGSLSHEVGERCKLSQ